MITNQNMLVATYSSRTCDRGKIMVTCLPQTVGICFCCGRALHLLTWFSRHDLSMHVHPEIYGIILITSTDYKHPEAELPLVVHHIYTEILSREILLITLSSSSPYLRTEPQIQAHCSWGGLFRRPVYCIWTNQQPYHSKS